MYKITLPVILLMAICVACQKPVNESLPDSFLKADSTVLHLSATTGGVNTFRISSTVKWQITIEPATADWLLTGVTTGNGSKAVSVNVTKDNLSDTVQKATIVISAIDNPAVKPVTIAIAQDKPGVKARNLYGGSLEDMFYAAVPTDDGGFIAVGSTNSKDGDVSGLHKLEDAWVVRVDASGNKVWQKAIGGSDSDEAYEIAKTADGNYEILIGSWSTDGDLGGLPSGTTYFKINGKGDILAKTVYQDFEWGHKATATDGTYMLLSTVVMANGFTDYMVTKVDANNKVIWKKMYGGSGAEGADAIVATADGGFLLSGSSQSNDGDVSGNHGYDDFWVVKIDKDGNKLWQKCYGGTGGEYSTGMVKTSDGGFVILGVTSSSNGDVTGLHGDQDLWVLKIDANGNKLWQKTLGGSGQELAYQIINTLDGNLLIASSTRSGDGDVTGFHGGDDAWVIKMSVSGNVIWKKAFGGKFEEWGEMVLETSKDNYALIGVSWSNDGDAIGSHGQGDGWIFKFK